jgi:hypothetical protein
MKDSGIMSSQLKYHRDAAKLLPHMPRFSESAAELVEQREARLGIRFPESVREWYSLEGAVQLLERYSNDDSAFAVDELGEPFDDWYGGGQKDFLSNKLLLFMHENQGVCNWAIKLNGDPDPAVVVEVDTAPDAKWLHCTDRFSTFVWCQIWDHSQLAVGVSAQEIELSEHDLCFLRSNFQELHTTYGWPGSVNYRFKSENAAILIWDGEDRGVDWFVSASTATGLKKLLDKLWLCGDLARSIYGDGEADEVVRELRSRPGEHHTTSG